MVTLTVCVNRTLSCYVILRLKINFTNMEFKGVEDKRTFTVEFVEISHSFHCKSYMFIFVIKLCLLSYCK